MTQGLMVLGTALDFIPG